MLVRPRHPFSVFAKSFDARQKPAPGEAALGEHRGILLPVVMVEDQQRLLFVIRLEDLIGQFGMGTQKRVFFAVFDRERQSGPDPFVHTFYA
jgi:hypothetical protein